MGEKLTKPESRPASATTSVSIETLSPTIERPESCACEYAERGAKGEIGVSCSISELAVGREKAEREREGLNKKLLEMSQSEDSALRMELRAEKAKRDQSNATRPG
ncbi:uncharacterized protein MYCGRDRAFT_98005 [Zymoseptoria tritici IPO323]|uniref:Uncharacterized protein n=1 Tax=Zymoseptoria tritici (strain CBS 115943 / IPO323) TaxID=336722 RepID=F9XS15_ZYMTI|nr:uncharacterized protein MYCGRDRAFT_98005 [Zymoseptoria tritici IPO323]EGP81958.1 hypothetical protein MYCGRDRAFT_98005 [Zymoseptoria tritici IPO323]